MQVHGGQQTLAEKAHRVGGLEWSGSQMRYEEGRGLALLDLLPVLSHLNLPYFLLLCGNLSFLLLSVPPSFLSSLPLVLTPPPHQLPFCLSPSLTFSRELAW